MRTEDAGSPLPKKFFAADWYLDAAAIASFLLVWEIAPRMGGLLETFISPPSGVCVSLYRLTASGELPLHVAVSLGRALVGFVLATMVGIPLGFVLAGRFPRFERIVAPVLSFLGKLNPFSLFPLFVVLFGIGEVSKAVMVFWVCLWPILAHTTTGVREIDPVLIKAARAFGGGPLLMFVRVAVPAASPAIFTGLKAAAGTAFFMLVAAEMIGASRGLGWLVWNAQMNFLIPQLFAATVCISLLGLTLNALLTHLERRFFDWTEVR